MTTSLAELIGQTDPLASVRLRQATVVAAPSGGTCTIRFGGADVADNIPGVRYLAGASIRNGDTVQVLQTGGVLLVLNRVDAAWTAWVPTVTQSGAVAVTVTHAAYTKVGRTVTISAEVSVTGTGTAANPVVIGGLPFPAAITSYQAIGVANLYDNSAGDDLTGVLTFNSSNNTLRMLSTRANGLLGNSSFTAALANLDNITFQGTYEASS